LATKETTSSLAERIRKLKHFLTTVEPGTRVVLVSHGTFLRTLFFGVEELKHEAHHIKNLGMIHATFDQATGDWKPGSVKCWDPRTGADASGPDPLVVCFDKIERTDAVTADKGPVHTLSESPPVLARWQTRELSLRQIGEGAGAVGIEWKEPGQTHVGKEKGAARVVGLTDDCEVPDRMKGADRSWMCMVVQRVEIGADGPKWEDPANDKKWDVLRVSWEVNNSAAAQLFGQLRPRFAGESDPEQQRQSVGP
jgi:hypothetical protein